MNEEPSSKQEAGKMEEAPAATPECSEGWRDHAEGVAAGNEPDDCAKTESEGAGAPLQSVHAPEKRVPAEGMGPDPGKTSFQRQAAPEPATAGGPEGMYQAEAQAGCAGGQPAGVAGEPFHAAPGPGPHQTAPFPGADPYSAQFAHQTGFYGHPAYGPPNGGPGPWPHPGPGHHPGCFPHHGGMYAQQPHGPYVGAMGDPGYGHAAIPLHQGNGDQHFGRLADTVGKALQGDATPQDLISGLLNLNFQDDQFWKGVVVGSVAALLLNSDTVKQALAGALGGVLGKPAEKPQAEKQSGDKEPPDIENTQ